MVSTSPVVWSQVRRSFLLSNVFCTINHDGIIQHKSIDLSFGLFPYIYYYLVCTRVYSSQRSSSLMDITVYSVQEYIVFTSPLYEIGMISSHTLVNGASLQGNSLPRYILYTSSVQDLYLPLRFLLQRQSHASCQD